jgi:hypothetical protein
MAKRTLFELPPGQEQAPAPATRPGEARVLRPVRTQLQWLPHDLEAAVAPDHPARAIWGLLERLDLAAFYGGIKATLDRPGRPTTDPQVLLAVWLLGTVEGVGSARRLAQLCAAHDARRLPLAVRWRAHQLPHALGLPRRPPGRPGRPADPDRGKFAGGRRGDVGARGPGRDARARQRRGRLLPAPRAAGDVPGSGARPSAPAPKCTGWLTSGSIPTQE